MNCPRCKGPKTTSIAVAYCASCLYELEMGEEKAARQRELAAKERKRRLRAQRVREKGHE
jgi:uncharacterized Zn finger protein (UPF0148 family)